MKDLNNVISVIVPVYKVKKFLDKCVTSIINQTYPNLQIILVDDGSPDCCGEMCEEWKRKDRRVEVIHKKNGGLSDARNAGLDIAKGDFIAFVDSDDWIEPQMYEIMMRTLISRDADLVACGIADSYSEKTVIRSSTYREGKSEKFLKLIYQDTIFPVSAWNKLYRKDLWKDFRFPVGKICEDAFTTYLLVDRAVKIIQIPDILYHYCIREKSIMTSEFRIARMDEEEAWYQNYQYIQEKYPQIAKIAYDFYLQKVDVLIHTIPIHQYSKFGIEYAYLYDILHSNLKYVLFRSSLSWKYRIHFFMDILKMKRPDK